MNMSKLRRALERGNKVVLFDKVRDPLRPESRILYESYAVFAKFEDLQKSWKYQQKLNLQRRSPVGVKAVVVPDLDQLPGEAAARHELAGLGRAPGRLLDRGGVRRDRPGRQLRPRRLLRRPVVRRFHFVPLFRTLP